ncbi:uncharacterized protein LOC130726238 [Lotus japonicus]|uniref:uncharacterized protein LOC130726238 n=1 Tax=Lotus japonicus TaxID=34305 RepID=UPI0025884CBE|nr:uncharacterized protein LOC130726238 [Lotus japonicus]XP_057433457.1 uncharacterized protein LOC130726238 [Lotus japonicus]XP_057433459.1 uncharacterized protein LOC130726238 [Lotus japonicus]
MSMIMMEEDKQHFCSRLCSNLVSFLPVMLVLVFSFFFFLSASASFPFFLAISIALISTIFLVTLRKRKGSLDESLVQDKLQEEELGPSLDDTQTEVHKQSETNEDHEEKSEAQSDYSFPSDSESSNFSIMAKTFELNIQELKGQGDLQSDSSLPSDSESSAGSIMGECFEIDHNGYQNVSSSDSLAAYTDDDEDDDDYDDEEEEEDSLIEINLPRSHFSDLTEEPKQKLGSKLPDFHQESIFKQQCLMELLAEINEMNEDENLIEIDISMGSTKSRDFQLKQELPCLGDQCFLSD